MTIQYTIKHALSFTPESIQALPLEEVESIVSVLATSTDKKAVRKLDMIQGILNGRKKEATTPEEKAEVVAVENSVKRLTPAQMKAKKAKIEADKKAEAELLAKAKALGFDTISALEEEAKNLDFETVEDYLESVAEATDDEAETVADLKAQKEALEKAEADRKKAEAEAKAKKAPTPSSKLKDKQDEKKAGKPSESDEVKKLKAEIARLKAVEKEAEMLKDGIFQSEIEIKGGVVLKKISLPTVADVTKTLIERPYTLQMHVHEGIDSNLTVFNVLFMNSNVLVLLDRSREIDSVLPIKVTNMTADTITIDNRKCPFRYYISDAVAEAEAEEE